jgi:hypothetical protein
VDASQPGIHNIGGSQSVHIPLYDNLGKPTWLQESNERELPDVLAIGIRVPKFIDMVRIPVSLDQTTSSVVEFQRTDIHRNLPDLGTDVVIVGYPYGYSAMGVLSPSPIFLKRAIAANMTESIGRMLLDGGAAPGMSGAPVIIRHRERWWLVGMYTGVISPDFQFPQSVENDRQAALGTMVPIHLGRAAMQVPGLFDEKH